MARDFTSASDKVENTSFSLTGYPFTMAVKANVNSFSSGQGLIGIVDKSVVNVNYGILKQASTTTGFRIFARNTSFTGSNGATGRNTGQWYFLVAVFRSATDRELFIDGSSDVTSATSVTYNSNVDAVSVGQLTDSTPTDSMDAKMADAAIWPVALTNDEVNAYSNGVNPSRIRPNARINWPIYGNSSTEADVSGNGFNGTVTGATKTDHAPVGRYATMPRYRPTVGIVVPAGRIMSSLAGHGGLAGFGGIAGAGGGLAG